MKKATAVDNVAWSNIYLVRTWLVSWTLGQSMLNLVTHLTKRTFLNNRPIRAELTDGKLGIPHHFLNLSVASFTF